MSAVDELERKYPTLVSYYKSVPELWNLLVWGTTAGWTDAEMQDHIQQTQYFKTRSEPQRAWDKLVVVNPGEAAKQTKLSIEKTTQYARQLGAYLTPAQLHWIAVTANQNGWTEEQLHDYLVADLHKGALPFGSGEYSTAMTQVRALANEYAIPLTDKEALDYAGKLLAGRSGGGQANENTLRDEFGKRAQSLYPSLKEELAAGVTVAQWAQPYKSVAQQELGVAGDALTFNDPKWKAMLEGQPDKNGMRQPMTLSEWQTRLRTDAQYGFDKTSNGKAAAGGIANQLLEMFGHKG